MAKRLVANQNSFPTFGIFWDWWKICIGLQRVATVTINYMINAKEKIFRLFTIFWPQYMLRFVVSFFNGWLHTGCMPFLTPWPCCYAHMSMRVHDSILKGSPLSIRKLFNRGWQLKSQKKAGHSFCRLSRKIMTWLFHAQCFPSDSARHNKLQF